ncbi:DEAD/DEAH box helicase [Caulobacter sp. 17J80-11]|uniref:DEAD/DEAH box helicase n=1 Tax=Caulobacter sp. 17J80-11 TaxID=2763502 RepID=UPI0016534E34|nr:DEAD/DEAH box helicase [Caulobacter sp. 17J80-11]MBC6981141.1 DEAD/DEAH box helicase [Caulobacter sp. 17J80-11]
MKTFQDLGLSKPILQALAQEGYETPTPIQTQAIPLVASGRDLLGIAQTGTGKTAAFALPMLHRLAADRKAPLPRTCRALILSPTRELASQIAESFKSYGRNLGMSVAVVFGGVKYGPQERAMSRGVDVLVATPGRLLDHMSQKTIDVSATEIFVLDEADQMLDLGFVKPIRQVVSKLSKNRQNLFFSATMPGEIGKLAAELLKDPAKVEVKPAATTAEKVEQQVLFVEQVRKRALLSELFSDPKFTRTLVFTKTKHGADKVAAYLEAGGVEAAAIHGNKSQSQRERALQAFKDGRVRALVATDIAARGIDVDGVTHVVNFELPYVPEAYVHRIGRTARAGASGVAVSLVADDERKLLKDIQRVTRQTIPSWDRRNDRALGALDAAILAANPGRKAKTPEPVEQPRGHGRPKRDRTHHAEGAPRAKYDPMAGEFGAAKPEGGRPEGQRAPKRGGSYRPKRRRFGQGGGGGGGGGQGRRTAAD